MARVGGRNTWIAAPVGVGCAVIVAALVWMSMPMVPVTVAWAGDMLRNATTPRPEPSTADTPALRATAGATLDCREIYSDALWNELTWAGRTILDQSTDPPATAVTSLTDVLAPDVRLTCAWTTSGDGMVVSTLAVVAADASGLADAALRGQGFACATDEEGLRCVRSEGATIETHVVRAGLWLSSVERTWHPDDYAARVERQVFG